MEGSGGLETGSNIQGFDALGVEGLNTSQDLLGVEVISPPEDLI